MNPIEINFSIMKVGDSVDLPANPWPCPHARKALENAQKYAMSCEGEVKPQFQITFQPQGGYVKGIERIR